MNSSRKHFIIAAVLGFLGIAAVVYAAFLIHPILGFGAVGAALLFFSVVSCKVGEDYQKRERRK